MRPSPAAAQARLAGLGRLGQSRAEAEEGRAPVKLSTDHIMTTHVGSLPRPPDLLEMLEEREAGAVFDEAPFEARLAAAVRDIVEQQIACGMDSVCDGEQSKISYTFYVRHRLSGIGSAGGGGIAAPPPTAGARGHFG